MKKNVIIALSLMAAVGASGKVKLPSVLSGNMVLQQQSDVKLWGKAAPGATVKVTASWSKSVSRVKAASDSTWAVTVSTPEAGLAPQTLTFDDGDRIVLDNILIGEVWFCSGQSNMEMPMMGFDRQPLTGTNDIIARAKPTTPIRMFITDSKDGRWVRQQSRKPMDDCRGEWLDNSPENVANASATAWFFASYVQDVLQVPVGIIVSTLGGSRIEPWMSRESLREFPAIDTSVLDAEGDIKNPHSMPCVLYNAKVSPFTGFRVRGFLWYQGESNRDNADLYARLMPAMVKDWRVRWGGAAGGDLPFYYVEIAPFDYEGASGMSAARMREVQAGCLKTIPNSGMASTIDAGNPVFIHPTDKQTVGRRLAWLALAKTYGRKGFGHSSPVYRSMEVKDGKIYINVDNAERGLCPMWTSLKGFEIAGADRVFHPAFAEIETSTCRLAVSSRDVPEPVAVRYAYCNTPDVSVYNIHGLPLLPFRTDNW